MLGTQVSTSSQLPLPLSERRWCTSTLLGATASRTTAFHCSVAAHVFAAWTYAPAASSHLKLVPGWQLLGHLAPFAAQKRNYFSRTASWVPMLPSPGTVPLPFIPPAGGQVTSLVTWLSSAFSDLSFLPSDLSQPSPPACTEVSGALAPRLSLPRFTVLPWGSGSAGTGEGLSHRDGGRGGEGARLK